MSLYVACITGCHGVGKTTVCSVLSQSLPIAWVSHDIPRNQRSTDPYLQQIQFLDLGWQQDREVRQFIQRGANVLTDRWGYLDVMVYTEAKYQRGDITKSERLKWYEYVNQSNRQWLAPSEVIILNASPQTIHGRLAKREQEGNRKGHWRETDFIYLSKIIELYLACANGEFPIFLLPEAYQLQIKNIVFRVIDTNAQTLAETIEIVKMQLGNLLERVYQDSQVVSQAQPIGAPLAQAKS